MHRKSPLEARPVLCLVTDRTRILHAEGTDGRPELVEFVREAACAGVDLIQIREPNLIARDLYELVCACVKATAHTDACLVVNDRFDVALAAGAAGVHLRSNSPDGSRVRPAAPAGFLIGRSVHGPDEAVTVVETGGLDYLIAGTVFPTPSKAGMPEYLGLEGLRSVVRRVNVPVLAIGGVTTSTIVGVAASGAAGFAAIGLFADAGAHGAALAQLVRKTRHAFDTPRSVS
jgi:thiamine-phosphate pyrophosphorylase